MDEAEAEAAVRGYFALEQAKPSPSIAAFGRTASRLIWGTTAFVGAVAAYRLAVDGLAPWGLTAIFVLFVAASLVALSAVNDSKAFGDGFFVLVKPDTVDAMRTFAAEHPEKAVVLALERRGDGDWAPVAMVRLQEIGGSGFQPILYDFYEPRGKRAGPAKPRIGPGGEPVCLLGIHGQRHSFDSDLSAAADIVHARTVTAVRT